MFGFHLISNKQFDRMTKRVDEVAKAFENCIAENEQLQKDIENLREQNLKLRLDKAKLFSKEQNHLKRINELLKKLKEKYDQEFYVLCDTDKCSICKHEFKNCKKLVFGDKIVCVIPKPHL